MLRCIMPSLYPDDPLDPEGDDDPLIPQSKRVAAEYERLDNEFMRKLSIEQAMTVVANGSRMGCPICPDCMQPNTHGHDDDCSDRPHRRTVRHDSSKHLFVAAIRRIKGATANLEPRIEAQSMRRTDWRVHGTTAAGGGGDTDYDITFISLTNATAQRAPDRAEHLALAAREGMRVAATKRLQAYLDAKARSKSRFYTDA
ncbi:unnamed protein product, partial [Tilletia caries]